MENAKLNIIEVFASVQGETSFTGLPTTFIRLAACNLRCTWCDTTYSLGRSKEVLFSPVFESLPPKTLVEWILQDQLPVRLNLQIHKFIWSPTQIGV